MGSVKKKGLGNKETRLVANNGEEGDGIWTEQEGQHLCAARGSEASGMGERIFSDFSVGTSRTRERRECYQGRSSVTSHTGQSSLFSAQKNGLTAGKGRPTLQGKERATTGTRTAPSTLHGLRGWL